MSGRPSDGELAATLAAARGQDRAAGAGAHPQAEAVHLVTAAVVRLVRTLAHEEISETVRVCEVWGRARGVGWHRPSAGAILVAPPDDPAGAGLLRGVGGAWTCGTGRHRFDRPTVRGAVPAGSNRAACGQPLDPQVAALVSVRGSRDSPRSTAPSSRHTPGSVAGPAPRNASDLGFSGFRAAEPPADSGPPDHPSGQHAQPVDKRVDRPHGGPPPVPQQTTVCPDRPTQDVPDRPADDVELEWGSHVSDTPTTPRRLRRPRPRQPDLSSTPSGAPWSRTCRPTSAPGWPAADR